MHFFKLLFFVLASCSHEVLSQYETTAIMRVTKDANTSLYKVGLTLWDYAFEDRGYLLDLDAPFTWEHCVMSRPEDCIDVDYCFFPLRCDNSKCIDARSYINPNCSSLNITAKYGFRVCAVTPINPVSNTCKISQLTSRLLWLSGTDGRDQRGNSVNLQYMLSCAPPSLRRSLPEGVTGVAAFSWSNLAFPRQQFNDRVTEKFALCLPNSSLAPGVAFIGGGPYYFHPKPNLDVMSILSYTPMIRKTSKSLGYYVKISNIFIRDTPITLPSLKSSLLAKLSTLVTYTTFRSDIYKSLLTRFSKATKNIPRVKAVKPFSLCMKASMIRSTNPKFSVPNIDLEMESGKIWTISANNSMKTTGNGVSCLAFIDGGSQMEEAVVIGTYQMENNFLFFDLGNQKLGFSSSMLARGISCSSFNPSAN